MEFHTITNGTTSLVNSILSIVLIIKLMVSGHPKGKPYLQEICQSIYPNENAEVIVSQNSYFSNIPIFSKVPRMMFKELIFQGNKKIHGRKLHILHSLLKKVAQYDEITLNEIENIFNGTFAG